MLRYAQIGQFESSQKGGSRLLIILQLTQLDDIEHLFFNSVSYHSIDLSHRKSYDFL